MEQARKAFPRVLHQLSAASLSLLCWTVSQIQEKHCLARLRHSARSPYARGILAKLCTLAIILSREVLEILIPTMLMKNFLAKIKPK